jgi:hypothetical protein
VAGTAEIAAAIELRDEAEQWISLPIRTRYN